MSSSFAADVHVYLLAAESDVSSPCASGDPFITYEKCCIIFLSG